MTLHNVPETPHISDLVPVLDRLVSMLSHMTENERKLLNEFITEEMKQDPILFQVITPLCLAYDLRKVAAKISNGLRILEDMKK